MARQSRHSAPSKWFMLRGERERKTLSKLRTARCLTPITIFLSRTRTARSSFQANFPQATISTHREHFIPLLFPNLISISETSHGSSNSNALSKRGRRLPSAGGTHTGSIQFINAVPSTVNSNRDYVPLYLERSNIKHLPTFVNFRRVYFIPHC